MSVPVSRVGVPPLPHGIPPHDFSPDILVRVVTLVSKVPTVTGMGPPEPGILVSVVTFEAMQFVGVSKLSTLTWMGHGFGLRRAQLLTLNPKPFHTYSPINPRQTHHPHHRGGAGANPKPKLGRNLPCPRERVCESKPNPQHRPS